MRLVQSHLIPPRLRKSMPVRVRVFATARALIPNEAKTILLYCAREHGTHKRECYVVVVFLHLVDTIAPQSQGAPASRLERHKNAADHMVRTDMLTRWNV
eukprot:5298855-Amphidinium_carterae.1